MRHNKEEFMRTMKRVAAVALSVVVLMTSGVSAKAAVTDVQPAKSKDEAVEKWVNKLMPDGAYDTLSEIKVVGNYIYAAEDSNHRIIKITNSIMWGILDMEMARFMCLMQLKEQIQLEELRRLMQIP